MPYSITYRLLDKPTLGPATRSFDDKDGFLNFAYTLLFDRGTMNNHEFVSATTPSGEVLDLEAVKTLVEKAHRPG